MSFSIECLPWGLWEADRTSLTLASLMVQVPTTLLIQFTAYNLEKHQRMSEAFWYLHLRLPRRCRGKCWLLTVDWLIYDYWGRLGIEPANRRSLTFCNSVFQIKIRSLNIDVHIYIHTNQDWYLCRKHSSFSVNRHIH